MKLIGSVLLLFALVIPTQVIASNQYEVNAMVAGQNGVCKIMLYYGLEEFTSNSIGSDLLTQKGYTVVPFEDNPNLDDVFLLGVHIVSGTLIANYPFEVNLGIYAPNNRKGARYHDRHSNGRAILPAAPMENSDRSQTIIHPQNYGAAPLATASGSNTYPLIKKHYDALIIAINQLPNCPDFLNSISASTR